MKRLFLISSYKIIIIKLKKLGEMNFMLITNNVSFCPGNLTQWTEWYCPATCNIYDDVNNPPQETRTRMCIGATGPGNCSNEARFEKRDCATNGCPGNLCYHFLWIVICLNIFLLMSVPVVVYFLTVA